MNSLMYPDSGNPLEDASVLRNAVYFSTAQRAYSASLVLQQPLNISQRTIDFLTIRAFEEFMISAEDMLGWFFALQEWQPGNAEFSLFLLIDKIQVGRILKQSDYSEDHALSILSKLDAAGFRKLFHIPEDSELLTAGMDSQFVDKLSQSIPHKFAGWTEIAKRRAGQDRGLVRMFNKCKHHMYAFPTRERDKNEVWLPASIELNKTENRINLERGWIESNLHEIRRFISDAITTQATLHNTLALILGTRYNEKYIAPQWVVRAYHNDYMWHQ
jgi:hypothetical protein